MIPGVVINALTFPGVMVHEYSHAKACKWRGVRVYEIGYLDSDMGGHVKTAEPRSFGDTLAISLAPFLGNTVLSAVCFAAFFVAISNAEVGLSPQLEYGMLILILGIGWLALSIGWHAIPSHTDAGQILAWRKRSVGWRSTVAVVAFLPVILLIYVANLLRFVWFDAVYSIGIGYGTYLAVDALIGIS